MTDETEVEFVREIPSWVKGWVVAREAADYRVWPQQKPGYDTLQRREPWHRTYVWSEQDWMPEDEQARWMDLGSHLKLSDVLATVGKATKKAGMTPDAMAALMADV